ncbi:uncharacterized protein ACR2FA_005691 [Aphomia sociella]
MELISKYLIIVTSLMTVKLTLTESKNNVKPANMRNYFYMPYFINICDVTERRSKLHCYCDNNKPHMATTADCWVFSGGIQADDIIWPNFSSQSEIEYLMFNVRADNALHFIPSKAIVRLDKLKQIVIQFGTITSVPSFAFTNSTTIQQIVLKSNKIITLEKHAFSQMMLLSNLSLDDNQITELETDVFFNLPNLHYLYLSNNNISLLHEGCFKHLNNLMELRLNNNYISVVTKEMWEGLENLSKLNLRHNKLTMIGNLAFSDSYGLKELLLDHNAIEYVSERALSGLAQLRKLTLSGNKLPIIFEGVLEEVKSLAILDLRDNLLETMSYETIRPLIENDKSASAVVYLDGNPLNCDCRLSWVYLLRNETKHNNLRKALDKILCVINTSIDRKTNEESVAVDNLELADDSYDYYDKTENYDDYDKPIVNKDKKLVDIPIETLPCPKEIMQSMEETYGHPVQNEIRVKGVSASSNVVPNFIVITLVCKLLFQANIK